MRINFEDPSKAHLTMPQHELQFATIWHTQIDACYMRVEDEDYLHFEGRRYGRNPAKPKEFWHPSQLIIDICRMARTKAIKFLRTYVEDKLEYDLNIEVPGPVVFPAHLTLKPAHHGLVTAFHDSLDVVALRTGGNEILRIFGTDYVLEDDGRKQIAAGYVDLWDDMSYDQAMISIAQFLKKR